MAAPTRAQWLADARALLDLIEANPDLPLNLATGLYVSYYPFDHGDDDADRMAAVDAVADQLGVPVTPQGPGSHYEVEARTGSASYKAIAVLRDQRDEYETIQRLGAEALTELRKCDQARVEVEAVASR